MIKPASLAALGIALIVPGAGRSQSASTPNSEVQINRGGYRGWPDAVFLRNGEVEAVIVPAIGRVMQFRFVGEADGPFWENPTVDGRRASQDPNGWVNYGGDKVWPAPQAAWPLIIGRGWPPPAGFDGRPAHVEIRDGAVTLVFPPDPAYGLQVRRRITLRHAAPVMAITTTFEKNSGPPVEAGVWTITQLRDPEAVRAPAPESPTADGVPVLLGGYAAPPMKTESPWLVVTRDPAANHKIGFRTGPLLWTGAASTLRLDSEVVPGAAYPDHGSSAEIYTNADPPAYVELELLGPLTTIKAGERIEQTVTYTLGRRGGSPTPRRADP